MSDDFSSFKQFDTLCISSSLVFPFFPPLFYFSFFLLFLFPTIREGYFCFISHGIMRSTFPNRGVLSRFIDRHAVFSNPPSFRPLCRSSSDRRFFICKNEFIKLRKKCRYHSSLSNSPAAASSLRFQTRENTGDTPVHCVLETGALYPSPLLVRINILHLA